MKLKNILLAGLSLTVTAAIAIGGTLAYLTSTDDDVNVMTLGNVEIEQIEQQRVDDNANQTVLEDFEDDKPLYPAVFEGSSINWAPEDEWVVAGDQAWKVVEDNSNVVDKFVTVKNTGKSDAYVRTLIAYEGDAEYGPNGAWIHIVTNGSNVTPELATNFVGYITVKDVVYTLYEYVYPEALAAGETTIPSLKQVYMNKAADNDVVAYYGDTYDIIVISQAVQTAGFSDAKSALDTAFGDLATADGLAAAAEWFDGAAAPAVDTWDGTTDTTWYNDTDTEFTLTTAEQLAGFGKLVDEGNTFAGKTVNLGIDMDFYCLDDNGEKVSFDPIGYGYNVVFKGTFDGCDHTISNLYQNGWALGLDYSTEGGGLFASVVDATIKNLKIDKSEIIMECIDMGTVVGYSYGTCTYENILITNSSISNYNRYTGGVVGEINGTQTFKNVDVDASCTVSTLWGSFDTAVGGIIGGKWGEANVTFEDCDVACVIDAYNDVTATPARQWYAYRRAGMLIGNSEETTDQNGRAVASASYLTAINCTVTYGDWANYTYCEFNNMSTSWPHCRVQAGSSAAYTNARYGAASDLNGNKVVDDNHVHADGEDHNMLLAFDQLFGGDVGVYGGTTHDGVTVK